MYDMYKVPTTLFLYVYYAVQQHKQWYRVLLPDEPLYVVLVSTSAIRCLRFTPGNLLCKDEKKIQSAWRVPPFRSDRPWLRIQQPDPEARGIWPLQLMWLTGVSDMYNKFYASFYNTGLCTTYTYNTFVYVYTR